VTIKFDAGVARKALGQLPELAAQESLNAPEISTLFVPEQHRKALQLDTSIVMGMRGAGKSLWTAVLASPAHLRFVASQLKDSALERVTAKVGFGLDDTNEAFPSSDKLRALLECGLEPLRIWLTVVLRHALAAVGERPAFPIGDWRASVEWVSKHQDAANDQLTRCDDKLARTGHVLLVLFDAFDRLSDDWVAVRRLTGAALQLCLRLRSRKAIRLKFFLRPDLEEDTEIWRFPDSSKLRHTKVELTWRSTDLYGLIFTHLANSQEFGQQFRVVTRNELRISWTRTQNVYLVPHRLAHDDDGQRPVVEALADRYMGGGPKRGYTYTWVPLHLADAAGRVSPRSCLLAFREAARDTDEHRPDYHLPLRYSSIQEGVSKASAVRVREVAEDYPWVEPLLEAARGTVVPMLASELKQLWTTEDLQRVEQAGQGKLPPRRFVSDPFRSRRPDALIDDLVEISVLYRTEDGRLNMPDIFRVGFGIRRRGGVKPPR
jgi:hypothetical protein